MQLKAIIEDELYELQVPDDLLHKAQGFFDQMDRDLDRGWQMGREWVPNPDRKQRCQIVADKLYTAIENRDARLGRLMAGYILSRMPGVDTVEIDVTGEMPLTRFEMPPTQ